MLKIFVSLLFIISIQVHAEDKREISELAPQTILSFNLNEVVKAGMNKIELTITTKETPAFNDGSNKSVNLSYFKCELVMQSAEKMDRTISGELKFKIDRILYEKSDANGYQGIYVDGDYRSVEYVPFARYSINPKQVLLNGTNINSIDGIGCHTLGLSGYRFIKLKYNIGKNKYDSFLFNDTNMTSNELAQEHLRFTIDEFEKAMKQKNFKIFSPTRSID